MRIVYVAGRYRADNAYGIHANVFRAEAAALKVAQAGAMPLTPHLNTAHFQGTQPDAFWLEGTMELLRRCDAIYIFEIDDLKTSSGTRGELTEATRLALPVFYSVHALKQWLQDPRCPWRTPTIGRKKGGRCSRVSGHEGKCTFARAVRK